MRAFLWRAIYAAIVIAMLYWLAPLFLAVIHAPVSGPLWAFLQAAGACIAILYVIFGREPPYPW